MHQIMEAILMNKLKLNLWGREFDLDITYDCYSGETILETQRAAVKALAKMTEELDSSLDDIKAYCLSQNKEEIGGDVIENIFKYVIPKYLFVPRSENKEIISIMCNYKFDPESGIAIVFENKKLKEIGKQEIIL